MNKTKLKDLIFIFYITKHPEGYTKEEMLELIEIFQLEEKPFYEALRGCTGMIIEGDYITYPVDVYHAIICALEGRGLNNTEWD